MTASRVKHKKELKSLPALLEKPLGKVNFVVFLWCWEFKLGSYTGCWKPQVNITEKHYMYFSCLVIFIII